MSFYQKIKEILNSIFPTGILKDEPNLKKIATSSEVEILELAQSLGFPSNVSAKTITLSLSEKGNRLLWKVFYAPKDENGLPVKTGHTTYIIDDETKELVNKFYSPY